MFSLFSQYIYNKQIQTKLPETNQKIVHLEELQTGCFQKNVFIILSTHLRQTNSN